MFDGLVNGSFFEEGEFRESLTMFEREREKEVSFESLLNIKLY